MKEVEPTNSEEILTFEGDKAPLKDFYKQCAYNYEPQPDEEILVSKNGNNIIGAVRLCHEQGVLVLRGMQVREDMRGHHLGAKLLQKLNTIIGARECYCLPYAHLDKFYKQIGFEVVENSEVPDFLKERIQSYRNQKPNNSYLLMKKKAKV